ncbi:MAG: peptide transporter substrate-binding protein [Dehalococcoidia bacterium]|nr:peptide transporter substrate-binding protein [Dehalococcoidia bacterium]
MTLGLSSKGKSILTVFVVAMLGVGLACAGEEATPTSQPTATLAPTATATTAPTATLVPTATATLVPGQPTPTATLVPTATAVPTVTATAAPTATPRQSASGLTQLPGYKPEWGQPQRGGIMKLGMPGPTANLFRPSCVSAVGGTICANIYNQLLRYDPWVGMGSLIGDLARSWEFSGDLLTLTLKLEEGVRFHDNPVVPADIRGDEFVCEDVQASIDYYLRPPEPRRTPGTQELGHITGVSCPDGARGYTVVITFNQVLAKTLGSLTKDVSMLDKEWIDWYVANHPDELALFTNDAYRLAMGTGPMMPLEYQTDVVGKLRRNPAYFREGLPLLDGMDNYMLKDFTTRFTALATGQIHHFGAGTSAMLPGQVAQAERDFKDRIVVYSTLHTFPGGDAMLNLNRAPYNDRRVRQAINLAINRDDWLLFKMIGTRPSAVLMGYNGPYPQFDWGTPEEELKTWPGIRQPKDQDIAEANRLLDEVFGKGKRFDTTCVTRSAQNYMDWCLFFGDQIKKNLGIGLTMRPMETVVLSTYVDVCNYDVNGATGGATTGDPDARLYKYSWDYEQVLGPKCNLEGMTAAEPALQAEVQAMIAAQTIELDPVKRAQIVRAIDKKLTLEMMHDIMFGWSEIYYGTTPNVKGYTLAGFPVFLYSIGERTWLAK